MCIRDSGNSQYFCKASGGIINIVTYDKAAIAVADELSSDGDSCLLSLSNRLVIVGAWCSWEAPVWSFDVLTTDSQC